MNFAADKRYLSGKNFSGDRIEGKNMRVTRANGASFYKCTFTKVQFDSSSFANATFSECAFIDCSIQNSSFAGARIASTSFYRCDIVQCDFANAFLEGAEFILSKLEFSSFLEAFLKTVVFNECDLTGAHLLFASAKDVDYTGSNLHNCSVKLGCPFFRGSTFDGRQWSYMMSLINETRGNEDRHANVMPLVDKSVALATHRMMNDPEEEENF